jgi:hypothetical protein
MNDHREDHADRHGYTGPDELDVRALARGGTPGPGMFLNSDGEWETPAGGGGGITIEQAQDAIGLILTDSATIDFTYDDATPTITAIVKPDSIGPTHLAATAVTPDTYGDASNYPVFTVDADGRITSASESPAGGGGSTLWENVAGNLHPITPPTTFTVTSSGEQEFNSGLFDVNATSAATIDSTANVNLVAGTTGQFSASGTLTLASSTSNVAISANTNIAIGAGTEEVRIKASNAAPGGAQANGSIVMWVDQTNDMLKFNVKYTTGTVKSGEIPLF